MKALYLLFPIAALLSSCSVLDPNYAQYRQQQSHTVSPGDSLWAISRKYGKTVEAIQAANGLSSTTIRTGQTLNIPQ